MVHICLSDSTTNNMRVAVDGQAVMLSWGQRDRPSEFIRLEQSLMLGVRNEAGKVSNHLCGYIANLRMWVQGDMLLGSWYVLVRCLVQAATGSGSAATPHGVR